jgi:hypothetical protein
MEFWFERNLGVGKDRDTSLIVELPSDDWIWCANPIDRRRLPRGFSRRVSNVIGYFSRKALVQTSQYRTVSAVSKLKGERN